MNEVMTIQNRIFEIRGQRVMLDRDLAELYGVETKQLVRQVKRNIERFEGEDFMFELTNQEYNTLITSLRCQIGTSNPQRAAAFAAALHLIYAYITAMRKPSSQPA